ncbi:hypothetical protein [Paenibacillus oryzisoli]|uniref:Transmembrane protein n=1 Tax=Paenibacillus oryzisoli TaxID=1850517 RepID=A0A197ZXR1_9BACL|nr:hypothetical protein [Paenibacillus oryzisoli]OAS13964.1 hypothetical protein A8708_11330 [Paenibacillus oryzisoli]
MWNHRYIQKLLRYLSPASFAAIMIFLITVIALFTPPYIGMADNGDYFRILYSNGLYFNDPNYTNNYLGHFVKNYGVYQYFNENGATLFSSQSMFIKASLLINFLLFDSHIFDIRFQAGMYLILYAFAIYLFVEALTWKMSKKRGYLVSLLIIFVLGDTGYTAYFNSFYSESIVLIMTIFMVAAGILLYRKRYNDYLMVAVFVVSAIFLTTSKQQNAPVGMIIAVFGVFFLFIRKTRSFRAITATLLIAVFGIGIGSYVLIPQEFVNINKYHAMTRGVMMGSVNPEKTLESFGIDKQFAVLDETLYYNPYSSAAVDSNLMQEEFYNKYTVVSILVYYVLHPDQAGKMLNLAAQDAFSIRPHAMGNYEASTGKPFGSQTIFFSSYSLLKLWLAPKTFGFVILWVLIIIGLYMPSFVKSIKLRQRRNAVRLPLILMMITIGLSGIFVSIVGAGDADLAKHEFLFTLVFDLVTLITICDLIAKRLWIQEVEEDADIKAMQGGEFRA